MTGNLRRPALLAMAVFIAGLSAATPNAFAAPGRAPSTTDSQANALAAAVRRQAAAHPAAARHICYAAHVENIGWQQPVCDGAVAGTTGQGLRLEALDIVVSQVGGVCAAAHVEGLGWGPVTCAGENTTVAVGTVGRGLRLEALHINVNSGTVCANAHVENIGWQGVSCASAPSFALAGTTGRGLRMEAIQLTV
ncbi:hypothetical protein [Amycolatopsis sp. NPDC004079]|uniref:hypothetical protein n=1 Tax=Amycolatopsis sp. NPDC004079 TaxID=3154549 RepID=UPI00339DCC8B